MAARYFFSPASIIEIANHYEAKGEPWIHTIKDISAVRIYGSSKIRAASIPLRCKTLVRRNGTMCAGPSRPLQLKFRNQLISCPVQAPQVAIDENIVKHVNMSFSKLDASHIAHLPLDWDVKADLIARNHVFIEALAMIATEIDRLQDAIYANPEVAITNGTVQRFPPHGGRKYSFCQTIGHAWPVYRFRLPVVRESGRVATQYGRRAKVNPVLFVAVHYSHGGHSKRELKVPIFTRTGSDYGPSRRVSITYGNVGKVMTRYSAVCSTVHFKDLCVFDGGISVIAECTDVIARPQARIEIDDNDVLAAGRGVLTNRDAEVLATLTYNQREIVGKMMRAAAAAERKVAPPQERERAEGEVEGVPLVAPSVEVAAEGEVAPVADPFGVSAVNRSIAAAWI